MSTSLPSKEIISVDIPEVKEFSANFRYNYFVPNEAVSEDPTSTPKSILERQSENFDSSYIDNVATRIPRFVKFNFGPVFITNIGLETDEQNRAATVNRKFSSEGIIKKFYDKIISEDEFVSYQYTSVNFSDQSLDEKLFHFVSGSLNAIFEDMKADDSSDAAQIAEESLERQRQIDRENARLRAIELSKQNEVEEVKRTKLIDRLATIQKTFLKSSNIFKPPPLAVKVPVPPSLSRFIKSNKVNVNKQKRIPFPPPPIPPQKLVELSSPILLKENIRFDFLFNSLVQPEKSGVFFFEDENKTVEKSSNPFEKLKDVSVHAQINSRLLDRIVKGSYKTPSSTISSDLLQLANMSTSIRQDAVKRTVNSITNDEYKTVVRPYEVAAAGSSTSAKSSKRLVGYVIDKWEITGDGQYISKEPIFLENPNINSGIDFNVRYGATYVYQMRSIAEFTVPAINDEDNILLSVKLLISSKPTRKIAIKCHENVPPPHPTDLNAYWDYENNKLNLTWAFPPNPQRDIKQFQIFRRSAINEPYQLVQQYNFDDSQAPFQFAEEVPSFLMKYSSQPVLNHTDHDFKKNSKYIYCVAAIDAHAMTSNYSEQFEITFDRYTNRLVKKVISISGAPKQYPNLQLARDTFVDAMYDEGHTRMKVYFTPEYFTVYDEKGRNIDVVSTNKSGAEYRIQIINLDMQKSTNVDIEIDDRRTSKKQNEDTNPQRGLVSVRPDRFKE